MAEDASALENSSVEALVSMREGKGNSYHQPVSPRSHPMRIRKPNPRIFGSDDEDFTPVSRARKQPKSQIQKNVQLSGLDRKVAQALGVRLRNLLKLPKAHKWVCYEWFYSNLDDVLFNSENDFCICLRETFPQLKTRKLTRIQWGKIRRLMGKPRRCSPAFFVEERAALARKRELIRDLQQRKTMDSMILKDLPEEIPMTLVIGTKVTARLRSPQDGLFTGVIDALDTVNSTYRITFDRANLGSHSVPDIEVQSNQPQETIPVTAFQTKQRPQRPSMFTPPRYQSGSKSPGLVSDNDPLLGSSPLKGSIIPMEGSTLGGFPVKFLVLVTKLTKVLSVKKEKIGKLKELNSLAEKMVGYYENLENFDLNLFLTDFTDQKSFGDSFDMTFQQKYASIVLELEKLNRDLNEYLIGVQRYCQEIAPEQGLPLLDQPSDIKKKCEDEATDMVKKANMAPGRKMAKNERMLCLVARLTSLLLQFKTFSENDMHSFEFKSLQDTLDDIRNTIDPSNLSVFQNNVEIHVNHIQSGLTQMGNLHAFAASEGTPAL